MSPRYVLIASIAAGLVLYYALDAAGFVIGGASVGEALARAAAQFVEVRK